MFRLFITVLLSLLVIAGTAMAVDLTKIERVIKKAPTFKTDMPEYCLLVFGQNAKKKVWLIHDGDLLYVDRNFNGDLTEPDECIDDAENSNIPGVFTFQIDGLAETLKKCWSLEVKWSEIMDAPDVPMCMRAALAANPQVRECAISAESVRIGRQGEYGRAERFARPWDRNGMLRFAARPEEAPILHFGGPWQLALDDPAICYESGNTRARVAVATDDPCVWREARNESVRLALATPGIGPGSTVYVSYESIVSGTISAKLDVEYRERPKDSARLKRTYELVYREGNNMHYHPEVYVPDGVAGKATATITLQGQNGRIAGPTSQEITIEPANPPLKPISSRLKSRLEFSPAKYGVFHILFAPDGKQLIADEQEWIQLWDLETKTCRTAIKKDDHIFRSDETWKVSKDWRILVASTDKNTDFEEFVKDGKTYRRWQYDDAVEIFDLRSGKLLRTAKPSPAQGHIRIHRPASGGYWVTTAVEAGEFELGEFSWSTTVWNESLTESRKVASKYLRIEAFSADGRSAVVSAPASVLKHTGNSIRLYRMPEFTELRTILTANELSAIEMEGFACDEKVLVGKVTSYFDKNKDVNSSRSEFSAWDFESGKKLISIPAAAGFYLFRSTVSSDGRFAAVLCMDSKNRSLQVHLVDLQRLTWKSVSLEHMVLPEGQNMPTAVFHPSGSWLAVTTTPVWVNYEMLPQPQIAIIDFATGKIVETLISSPTVSLSAAISPDGATLATGGTGELLLWDVSDIAASIAKTAPKKSN